MQTTLDAGQKPAPQMALVQFGKETVEIPIVAPFDYEFGMESTELDSIHDPRTLAHVPAMPRAKTGPPMPVSPLETPRRRASDRQE